jgi:hypothetical protein
MRLRYRLIFLSLFLIALILIGFFITHRFEFLIHDFWFAAGLLLLLLISLIDQPFFSTDANIFLNGTTGLSLILVKASDRDFWWYIFLSWCIWLVISSYFLLWFYSKKPFGQNPILTLLSRLNRDIGKPEILFSGFFIWGAIRQFGLGSTQIEPLFAFWVVFILINLPSISKSIDNFFENIFCKTLKQIEIASLFRMSEPRVLEIRLNKNAPNQIVGKFINLTTNTGEKIADSVIIDDRVVTGARQAKIALINITDKWNYIANSPEKIKFSLDEAKQSNNDNDLPISVVDVGTTIDTLRFYVHPDLNLKKGELVYTENNDKSITYYQVTSANVTETTTIEKNNTKSVLVTCGQLGIWDQMTLRFEPFAWVAPAGRLVYRVAQISNKNYIIPETNALIGNIPNSDFPIHITVDDFVTHNTAMIGITGSGKSYLAFHTIETLVAHKIKVLILDLTREHYLYLEKLNPTALNAPADVEGWLKSESFLGIHQFGISKNYPHTTRLFVESAFNVVSKRPLKAGLIVPAQLCIVFEEAHSLIPEWNQVAERDDVAHVNATARTILQGRKFGMGSLIITQRTANVTKTILNQCNTIIAFQSFDQTGLEFLRNYMGSEYAQALSTLQTRDAVLVGKSSSSKMPVIFSIIDLSKKWNQEIEIVNMEKLNNK